MIDSFEYRTYCLENLCLAEFAATYNSNSSCDDPVDLNVEDCQDVDDFLNVDNQSNLPQKISFKKILDK